MLGQETLFQNNGAYLLTNLCIFDARTYRASKIYRSGTVFGSLRYIVRLNKCEMKFERKDKNVWT